MNWNSSISGYLFVRQSRAFSRRERSFPSEKTTSFKHDSSIGVCDSDTSAAEMNPCYTNPDSRTLTFTWDAASQRRRLNDPDGGLTSYTFDAAGRLSRLVDPQSGITTYQSYSNDRFQLALTRAGNSSVVFDTLLQGVYAQLPEPLHQPRH